MVSGVNRVILMGNLTADPEMRYTPQGTPVATFRLAVNRRYKAADGELKEEVTFVPIVTWSRTAETCTQYLNKGRAVLVEGRLNIQEYEKDGQRRWKTEIVADRVAFVDSGGGGARGATTGAGAAPADESPDDVPFY